MGEKKEGERRSRKEAAWNLPWRVYLDYAPPVQRPPKLNGATLTKREEKKKPFIRRYPSYRLS